MKAASQVPSGVLMFTSVSTTSKPAAMAEPAVAAMPAATPSATKSRLFLRSSVSLAICILLLLNALHPFKNRAGDAGVGGVGRHHFRNVTVILKDHVGWTIACLAQLAFQGLGKPDDVRRIQFGHGNQERQLGFD